MDTLLSPFGKQHCLLYVDNFGHLNLGELSYPVYQRKPERAFYCLGWECVRFHLVWVLTTDVVHNVTFELDLAKQFSIKALKQLSMYLGDGAGNYKHYVIRPINSFHHSVRSKPWNCTKS